MSKESLNSILAGNKLVPKYYLVNQGCTLQEIEGFVDEGVLKLVRENGILSIYDNQMYS